MRHIIITTFLFLVLVASAHAFLLPAGASCTYNEQCQSGTCAFFACTAPQTSSWLEQRQPPYSGQQSVGSGSLLPNVSTITNLSFGGENFPALVQDLDGDGQVEILLTNGTHLRVYQQLGSTLTLIVQYTLPNATRVAPALVQARYNTPINPSFNPYQIAIASNTSFTFYNYHDGGISVAQVFAYSDQPQFGSTLTPMTPVKCHEAYDATQSLMPYEHTCAFIDGNASVYRGLHVFDQRGARRSVNLSSISTIIDPTIQSWASYDIFQYWNYLNLNRTFVIVASDVNNIATPVFQFNSSASTLQFIRNISWSNEVYSGYDTEESIVYLADVDANGHDDVCRTNGGKDGSNWGRTYTQCRNATNNITLEHSDYEFFNDAVDIESRQVVRLTNQSKPYICYMYRSTNEYFADARFMYTCIVHNTGTTTTQVFFESVKDLVKFGTAIVNVSNYPVNGRLFVNQTQPYTFNGGYICDVTKLTSPRCMSKDNAGLSLYDANKIPSIANTGYGLGNTLLMSGHTDNTTQFFTYGVNGLGEYVPIQSPSNVTYGGLFGFYTRACYNATATYIARECTDVGQSCSYYATTGLSERLAVDCENNGTLVYGNYSATQPQVSCVWNSTGLRPVRVYIQSELNPSDMSVYYDLPINVTMTSCDENSTFVPFPDAPEGGFPPSGGGGGGSGGGVGTNQTTIGDAINSITGEDDYAKTFLGLAIFISLMVVVAGWGKDTLTFAGYAVVAMVVFALLTFLGLFPVWVFILIVVAMVAMWLFSSILGKQSTG